MQATHPTTKVETGITDIIRALLLVQGSIAVVSTIETLFAGLGLGLFAIPIVALTAGAALLTLSLARRIGRRSRRARKTIIWIEGFVLTFAAIDLILALALAHRGLELVPILTRIVLPIALIRMLRLRQVRAEFGLGPTRRQARKAARS